MRRRNRSVLVSVVVALLLLLSGCGDDKKSTAESDTSDATPIDAVADVPIDTMDVDDSDMADTPSDSDSVDVSDADVVSLDLTPLGPMDRPAQVTVPRDWDGVDALPIVVSLHGYGGDAFIQDAYLGISDQINSKRFIMLEPEALFDMQNRRRWNQTGGDGADDVDYIVGVIEEAQTRFNDDGRVFVIGHSNGGYMSYLLACQRTDVLTAIVPFAGLEPIPADMCMPSQALSILHVHGTLDADVPYAGYPMSGILSVDALMALWVQRMACQPTGEALPALDLDLSLVGADTEVTLWSGCDMGAEVTLWAIEGAGHTPAFDKDVFMPLVMDWLLAHPVAP